MDMKVLVVGGGGREHAITRALSCNSGVKIFSVMARKNPGIARLAERVLLEKETNIEKIERFAVDNGLQAAVIGPEAPLEVASSIVSSSGNTLHGADPCSCPA
jgi:phosphoribosylamine--glycine ligase